MTQRKTLASLAFIVALAAVPAIAADEQHDQHHPAGSANSPPAAAAAPGSPAPGMGMGMMGGNMPMMGMMQGQGGMGMMGGMGRMGGMGMMSSRADHIEGRIAFLKAELKITDAQLPLWNTVAEVMRANTKTMVDMRASVMGKAETMTLPDRLTAREKALTARLEGLRKLKAAVDPFYAALSDDQKKAADQIVTGMGMGMGGMGMGGMGMGMGMGGAGMR